MQIVNITSSLARKLGFCEGDEILSLGGYPFQDVLDYLYFEHERKFDAEILRNGKKIKIKVRKKEEESLGLEFEEMGIIRCKNKCVFCFVDQLPKGLRSTLYVKDDDYRLSFISGCYVTMTNVSDEEINRIIRLKLSPLYISVHAYTDEVRLALVKNPSTLRLISMMRKLGENGIKMHTQLVIVPEMNDGAELIKSIRGLHSIKGVETVAVVPVGLTGHRKDLSQIRPVGKAEAVETVEHVEAMNREYGGGFCWCSDEYYQIAERPIPNFETYSDFSQIENGVGLIADFKDNLDFALSEVNPCCLNKKITFITGVSFAPLLNELKSPIETKLGIKASVVGIKNRFFGESVTVAGLVVGKDIAEQAPKGSNLYVIPDNMLREFTTTFLDDMTVEELSSRLGAPILAVAHNGADLPQKIIDYFTLKA